MKRKIRTSFKTRFFYQQHFISNARLKLAKNHANAKQNPETELCLFKDHSRSSYKLSSKNNIYSKN